MIDEKKITEAAIQNADKYNPCRSTLDREDVCRASFEDGAKWFKSALWHDTLIDKPKDNAPIAILYEELTFVIDVLRNYKWEVVKSYAVKWCYLSDLLPKGGGK